ncbi:MAG TPA: zinc ribbon domain-containing protein [Candidatus Angelobacter sp.]|jgi:hypothetical protein|nr:zinc ribbon domain-containing protein [Candidatus Angelobacter sp.]
MFCENCGQSVSDNVAQCPHCHQATGAVAAFGGAGAAAVAVRSPIGATQKNTPSALSRVEQSIYFRFARGFSWFLLILIGLGILRIVIALAPVLIQTFGSSTTVNAQELRQAGSAPQRSFGQEEPEIDPSEMARLDQAAYEIIQLLPPNARQNNIDDLRAQVRSSAANLAKEHKEQLAILEELRDDLKALPEGERPNAANVYFLVKGQKIHLDQAKKEEGKQNLIILGASLLSSIALLTFVTMILVLLSIERNTRLSPA